MAVEVDATLQVEQPDASLDALKVAADPTSPTGVGLPVMDAGYEGGEVLPDQIGAADVLTFTFTDTVHMVVIDASGATTDVARADPFGGAPTSSLGIPCRNEVPTYLPVMTNEVLIYAPVGMIVSVYGYRRN